MINNFLNLISLNILLLLLFIFYFNTNSISQAFSKINDDFCKFPQPSGEEKVDEPKEVKGEVDFKFIRLIATNKLINDCSINGSVNGKHIIIIEDGGKISNLILGNPAKGIWCKGSCTLENFYFNKINSISNLDWEKVCYHAAGFSGNDDTPKIHKVIGGAAINAPDKFFTQSSKGKTIIENFCGHKFGKVYCSCGSGCKPQYDRTLNHNYKDTMFMSNIYIEPNTKVEYICQEYNGTTEVNNQQINNEKEDEKKKK
ncbi:hypothetical protein Mgra_00002896 [Meloidogyne graminicola]|uniref:Probable pectate lyase F n=1 Tax=Meloidogyne graminicola TaxID=189291 RepID=A0A8S9ZWM6_9BILA|nr:hypothetical protein Mgra_00002896 [Meloidogyne graminicola]